MHTVPGQPAMTALSLLELVRVTQDADEATALHHARDLAVHAERWGYRRVWVAEHHNMAGIASAATAIVIAHIAAGTTTIRVGAGGIMLPNHAPYIIAEQFGTLARLFPGRIDLGLGRAPGTDQLTVQAMRRSPNVAERFPQDVIELQTFLARRRGRVREIVAVPAAGTNVPLWIPGSSNFGAMLLAAELGLPPARLCVTLRARSVAAGARSVPHPLQAIRATRAAVCDGRNQRDCRGDRRRGHAPRNNAADVIR